VSRGDVVDAKSEDLAINPASVIKIATSWWALETLGSRSPLHDALHGARHGRPSRAC
jgi:D-alanyl-D-alanine carboxypeptidase